MFVVVAAGLLCLVAQTNHADEASCPLSISGTGGSGCHGHAGDQFALAASSLRATSDDAAAWSPVASASWVISLAAPLSDGLIRPVDETREHPTLPGQSVFHIAPKQSPPSTTAG